MTNRDKRIARQHAYLMLYQWDISEMNPEEIAQTYWEDKKEKPEVKSAAEKLFVQTVENLKQVDSEISRFLKKGWVISRLLPMDRSILRVSTFEILHQLLSPPQAVINDAVEFAKFYGEDERSPAFINAILDRIKERTEKQA